MFRRHKKPPVHQQVGYFFWPRTGWRRAAKYLFHRVARIPGPPYSIAAGFACGAAISFTPFIGLHLVLAALLAFIMRANIVASAIGTVVGNPWTFPFIWIWIYELGSSMIGDGSSAEHLDFFALFGAIVQASLRLDLVYLGETVWPVWRLMLIGSIPTFFLVWIATYLPLKWAVEKYQARRLERRRNKLRKEL